MPEGNGSKWQLAFWVLTVAFGAWLGALTTNVIANDRARVNEDQRVQKIVYDKYDTLSEKLTQMSGDIREIKALLKTR